MNCVEIVRKLIKIAENTGLYLSFLAEPCEPELTDKRSLPTVGRQSHKIRLSRGLLRYSVSLHSSQ